MNAPRAKANETSYVDGSLNYVADMQHRGRLHIDRSKQTVVEQPRSCRINNAWNSAENFSLERQGFIAVRHRTRFGEASDREALMAGYPDELIDLIRDLSGTSWIIPKRVDVVLRTFSRTPDRSREPVGAIVHSDYSPASMQQQARMLLERTGQANRPFRRVGVYQTWRALSRAPQERPLALCDGRSIRQDDRVLVDNVIGREDDPAKVFESTVARYNPEHRWFFFPDLAQDDLLIFRGADTETACTSNIFHTSFEDPTSGPDAVPRVSVESRFFCFYD